MNSNIAYECLNAIGNTFDLESMVSEMLITFLRSTQGKGASFYAKEGTPATIHIGMAVEPVGREIEANEEFSIYEQGDGYIVQIHLNTSSLAFAYDKTLLEVRETAHMFAQFNRKIIIAINACRGITQLELLNEELEQRVEEKRKKIKVQEQMLLIRSKQAMMGQMIEMIAHQWRQPLTAIGMSINNLLLDISLDELKPEELGNDLSVINKQIHYLSHTIDDFRNFFKENKKQELTNLNTIIEKILNLIGKQLTNRNISLEFENNCNIEFYTFSNELMQVFLNLISNAKDAFEQNKEDKLITLQCSIVDEQVNITFNDNAGGIPEDVLPHIFDPYFSTKKEKNGTGLGLYMSQTIIHEHLKGELSVKNINGGASFCIALPYKKEPIDA